DHGADANWGGNVSKNGLIVNGNDVTLYGLFVEHFQEYQTLWNGNGGRLYFYQSEMPYDPPSQAAWQHDGVNGYASYKVADSVTTHEAWGLGTYCSFHSGVVSDNSIETPTAAGVSMHHMMTSWLNGTSGSAIAHIVNGTGNSATQAARQAISPN
ncbi:MAG TPA: coagulation factor 5/8 type domain-containing protein, partial [Polyangiaceae bacterium]|nr:coagulation factor 5/8 type domain-containing protein [Polyangiaceae bacterium]